MVKVEKMKLFFAFLLLLACLNFLWLAQNYPPRLDSKGLTWTEIFYPVGISYKVLADTVPMFFAAFIFIFIVAVIALGYFLGFSSFSDRL